MIHNLSKKDVGRRVKAYITDGKKTPEYRTGTYLGIEPKTGLPLIKYDNIQVEKTAYPEWLVWDREADGGF